MSLPFVALWAIGCIALYVIAPWWTLLLWVLAWAIGYYISVRTHPDRACWSCGGSGRHAGVLWSYGRRPCSRCKGSGRHERFGRRFISS